MATKRRRDAKDAPHTWRRVILLAAIVLLGYVLITQVKSLSPSLHIIRHARSEYVLLGTLATVATFFVAALMYQLLALHRLSYPKTLLTQVASGFTNRLLPAGLGGMGLIAQYLRTQKHTTSEAVAVVGMDNVIGIIGHFSLFFVAIALANVSFTAVHLPHVSLFWLAALLVVVLFLGCIRRVRTGVVKALQHIWHDLASYRRHPVKLALALANSLMLTMLYVSILWVCAYAVNADLSFPKILVVFTAGSIVGNATPTPGGLVGTEAGLFGGFAAYGLSNGTALAAALLYRLLTYWLPILPGIIGFWAVQRKLNLFLGAKATKS
jgi:uncharacterized membrane protein YbhN (UPF0104 family)